MIFHIKLITNRLVIVAITKTNDTGVLFYERIFLGTILMHKLFWYGGANS